MRTTNHNRLNGFTIAELVLAMTVTSVILAAAASLAFAISSAEASTNEMSEKQARLRFSSVRIGELIRNSCMAFGYSTNGVVFWVEDENADGIINANEIAWLCTDSEYSTVRLIEFPSVTTALTKNGLENGTQLESLYKMYDHTEAVLLTDCANVNVSIDSNKEFVIADFDIEENDAWKSYQICGGLRASSAYHFNNAGSFVSEDDDL